MEQTGIRCLPVRRWGTDLYKFVAIGLSSMKEIAAEIDL